jgi:putative transposase
VRLALRVTAEQDTILSATVDQFTTAFNTVCRIGWDANETNGIRLHHAAYYETKSLCPGLVSDLLIQARVKATEALRSVFARRKKGRKVRCPQAGACPPRYNHHTATVKWDTSEVRLSTAAGRMTIPFVLPEHYAKYASGRTLTADLICRKRKWYLHVAVELSDPPAPAENAPAVGVDLGLCRPAVTSGNRFFGRRQWRSVEARYFRLRRSLQRKGTRSAKRHLRRLARRVNRFRRDCDHVLSRRIVDSVDPGSVIVVENLTDIRARVKQRGREARRRLHSWSFAQLRGFLEYKAEEAGCVVGGIDPRHTSQRCSRCGYTARNNRRSQSDFTCRSCGFRLNADLNGARNIAWKHLAGMATCDPGGPPSTGLTSSDPAGQAVGFSRG